MNVDALLPPTTPRLDSKMLLNRTLSTAVPSPTSSPSRQLTESSPEEVARSACVIASCLRRWRNSPIEVQVQRVKSGSAQFLNAFTVSRTGSCVVVVGGLAFWLGELEPNRYISQLPIEMCEDGIRMTQAELYSKTLAAARALMGSESVIEIPALVGAEETDIAKILAGAIMMNDYRDACF